VVAGLSLLAGVLLGLATARTLPAWWTACAAAAVALVYLASRRTLLARACAPLLAGLIIATLCVGQWQQLQWRPADGGARLLLEGTVRGVPAREGAVMRFDADVQVVDPRPDGRVRRARLSWRDAPVQPRAGERWRWLVRVSETPSTRSFAGLDVARIAMRDRVHLAGQVVSASLTSRQALAPASIDTLRARVALRIGDHVADPEAASLVTALAVGLTSGMSTDQWRVFNATGTTHLVAISGMHVTLFAALMFFVARRAWRALPLAAGITREPFALALGLLAAGGYSLLAGFSVPTQRTLLMLAVFALARISAHNAGAGRTWSLALTGVLLFDGFAPLAAGFWLSFIAVGVILLRADTALYPCSARRQWLELQWFITLCLAPLGFAIFGGVSLAGLVANLLAIPLVSFVFVPVVLAGTVCALAWPAACQPFFALAEWLHGILWPALVWAADAELAMWRHAPTATWLVLSLPAAGWLLLRWPWPLRVAAASLVLPLLFAHSRSPPTGEARIVVLDAGRGVAVLVITRAHAVLFDTGDTWNTHGTRAARVVIPAMDARGIPRLDRLILPRLDVDRAQGVALLAQERGVAEIVVGGVWPGTSLPVRACRDDLRVYDGVLFEVLAAASQGCALRVSVGGRTVLLGGDLGAGGERAPLAPMPAAAGDVVLVDPGASPRASSPKWIEAGRSRLAIAAGGRAVTASRARTLEHWRAAGVPILDVLREGDIEIELGKQGFAVLGTARSTRYPFAWRRLQ
jgi:competence protein ComEC